MKIQEKIQIIQARIDRLLEEKATLVVAIDGRCASGKTTLAAVLAEKNGYAVVHMDDFFLRPEQRTAQRLATPGENVDHERFAAEVLEPLLAGQPVRCRPFSCRNMALEEAVLLRRTPVTIVEGCYACHPALRENYDLRIFLDVDSQTQMARITARNGVDQAEIFRQKWIPLEEMYFARLDVANICELHL